MLGMLALAFATLSAVLFSAGMAGAAGKGMQPTGLDPATTQITHKDFDPADFPSSPRIDNPMLPLIPGTQYTLEGTSVQGAVTASAHTVVFTVTDATKVVNGVRTLVIWDRDFQNGKLTEEENAFFAQDRSGNVWQLGEFPEEFDARGRSMGAPRTWIAGAAGAEAGIHMFAQAHVGGPSYVQGFAPAIGFLNEAKIVKEDQSLCGPLRCYTDVLVIDEFSHLVSPLEPPKGHVFKYHAPGVGVVRTVPVGEPEAEVVQLTKARHLNPQDLGAARGAALRLDKRAYVIAEDVYSHTQPARPPGPEDQDASRRPEPAGTGSLAR
jgi:hypothetical protein